MTVAAVHERAFAHAEVGEAPGDLRGDRCFRARDDVAVRGDAGGAAGVELAVPVAAAVTTCTVGTARSLSANTSRRDD